MLRIGIRTFIPGRAASRGRNESVQQMRLVLADLRHDRVIHILDGFGNIIQRAGALARRTFLPRSLGAVAATGRGRLIVTRNRGGSSGESRSRVLMVLSIVDA